MRRAVIALQAMFALVIFFVTAASAQSESTEDKTLSPYFLVKSEDPNSEQLPLKSTTAQVNIAGVIADVKVTQVYKNEGKQAIEAIYVFPAPSKASVYGMKMTIGERTIVAKVEEREKARKDYEEAKQQGKSASLLEQQRPNVFQMNVANIMPNDLINVELSYTELLVPTDGVYEFAYPTVVGPRYSNKAEETAAPSEKWVQNPYLHETEAAPYEFQVTTTIAASIPIQEVTCSSHKVNINYDSPAFATIKLDPAEKQGGNRDYILKYRLSGGQIESGLLLYQGEKENFFLLMMQPPQKVVSAQIPAREYIFIVDVSGSMHGFPLEISKTLFKNLISKLKNEDTFNVLLFAASSSVLSPKSLPANSENISQAIKLIERQQGGGGTELLPALKQALALPVDEKRSRSIILATDGYVDVEKEAFEVIRENLGKANMFAFGIGSSVNRFLIEGIAHVGMAEPFIISKPDEAGSRAEKFREYVQTPVLTKAKIDFGGLETYDVEPPAIPDVFAQRPVIVFGKWKGTPQGKIRLSGVSGERSYESEINLDKISSSPRNSALRYLWARHRIMVLGDFNRLSKDDKKVKEITQLGLDYNLLTDYTSFVAIDSLVRNSDGKSSTVKQPLPLPQGVSDLAVGFAKTKSFTNSAAPAMYMKSEGMLLADDKAESTKEQSGSAEPRKEEERLSSGTSALVVKHLAGKMTVSAGLSREAVQTFIAEHLKEVEQSYLRSGQTGKGKLSFKISVDALGRVLKVETGLDEIKSGKLTANLSKLIKTWTFPAPGDGKPALVECFFEF